MSPVECRSIQINGLTVQVNAFAGEEEAFQLSSDLCRGNQVAGVHLHIGDFQLVNDHALPQQWQQLYIHRQVFHVGNGVLLLYHAETVNAQV